MDWYLFEKCTNNLLTFILVCVIIYNTNTRREIDKMSIVRYVNKKTGRVALYESTSHYDPETKQSRPIRKYLGTEDPETGELIPSSGKRGRKKESENNTDYNKKEKMETDYKLLAETLKKECMEKDARIKALEHHNQLLRSSLERIKETASHILEA